MAASHFFVGLGAGIAILAVPAFVFTPASSVPGHVLEWINSGPAGPLQFGSDDAASSRPLRGFQQGAPTPTAAAAAPTVQPRVPTALPTQAAIPAGQLAPNVGITANLRWAGTGTIRSGGVPVAVRRVPGVDSGDDPQLADGSPVLVAAGAPQVINGEQWRGVRALSGIVGWVPSAQLAVDGEATIPAPIMVAASAATPTPAPDANRGSIANTGGVGVVLRNSPNEADRSRVGLNDGTGVTVLEASGDWLRVQTDSGQGGWVLSRYVKGP
jgi:SH3-like domain-containing protein